MELLFDELAEMDSLVYLEQADGEGDGGDECHERVGNEGGGNERGGETADGSKGQQAPQQVVAAGVADAVSPEVEGDAEADVDDGTQQQGDADAVQASEVVAHHEQRRGLDICPKSFHAEKEDMIFLGDTEVVEGEAGGTSDEAEAHAAEQEDDGVELAGEQDADEQGREGDEQGDEGYDGEHHDLTLLVH